MGICRRDFCAALAGGLAAPLFALPARPKLMVLVVLDQFRSDYLDTAGPSLSPGGFRRLMDKGAWYPDCRHLASTFTTTSIATLATGAWPAQHGIPADWWYERSIRKPVPAADEALLATTLAAQIAAAPRTRVSVVSLNDVHGALFAGTPDARLFWMDDNGQFATLGDAPDWLAASNSARSLETMHDSKWVALGAKPDGPALRTLTWSAARPAEFLTLYKSSYFAQQALFEFAGELLTKEKMGLGNTFDFLCILAGSTGLLGYEIGAHSLLMQQMVLQLDRQVEALLNQLSKAPGDRNFTLALAAGHGAAPEPPADFRERMAVSGETVAQAVDRYLIATGSGRVEKYLYPFLYLDASGYRDPEPIRLAAANAAMGHSAVSGFYTAGGACSTHDEWQRRFRNSFHPTRSGDVMLSYHPEYVEDSGQNRGVSYGSLYNYDVRVPLGFYGPQFRPGVFESTVESVDMAPTLARAAGVAVPSSCLGRVLGEALAE